MQEPFSVIVIGTTLRTLVAVEALQDDPRFKISAVITPSPKPIGRKQILTQTPVHKWAEKNGFPVFLVNKKIDGDIKKRLDNISRPDYLLVVDFGYLIPDWLIKLPKIAPINIHPSALPDWRGSSPGQFSILYGEKASAVTIMIISDKMDQGSIVKQISFKILEDWTQKDYYDHSFKLVADVLANTLEDLASKKITPADQPKESKTPTARRLNKSDSFIPFGIIKNLIQGQEPNSKKLPKLLQDVLPYHNNDIGRLLIAASKAFSGWPELWTEIITKNGTTRMKLLDIQIQNKKLKLNKVHIAGHGKPSGWNQVKTTLLQQP